MIIVGVDPSFSCTGIVGICGDSGAYLFSATIESKPKNLKSFVGFETKTSVFDNILGNQEYIDSFVTETVQSSKEISERGRLLDIYYSFKSILNWIEYNGYDPDEIMISMEIPMGAHVGSGGKLDRIYAAFIIAAEQYILYSFTPAQFKKYATGKGNASKEQTMESVYRKWEFKTDNNNIADAYAMAKYGYEQYTKSTNKSLS